MVAKLTGTKKIFEMEEHCKHSTGCHKDRIQAGVSVLNVSTAYILISTKKSLAISIYWTPPASKPFNQKHIQTHNKENDQVYQQSIKGQAATLSTPSINIMDDLNSAHHHFRSFLMQGHTVKHTNAYYMLYGLCTVCFQALMSHMFALVVG